MTGVIYYFTLALFELPGTTLLKPGRICVQALKQTQGGESKRGRLML
jgi:hypothetical protein